MASSPVSALDAVAREITALPDGPAWIRGALLKRWIAAQIRDRVRGGANVDEIPTHRGRFFNAQAGSDDTELSPLMILDASDSTHAGRVRIVNGTLAGLLPAEMNVPDTVLPDGTDKHCYLSMQNGFNYILGKVAVDSDSGGFTSADVYVASSYEDPDGTYLYLNIGVVKYDGTTITITQSALGNQSVIFYCSADGTTLYPVWSPNS